ncbi:aminotransferase class III-fold pyridoxal phosphate-dependent enzyme [Couchioplanes caeruleus]|uniref:Acetylornithine aminotransferase n=1 Tax=Couchioplanes caeruleus TaxID=56438 RepID=A0A3N1GM42_9ACTN|nr:aminotransferase class III-fold pyridoxal phosphate-dependent enzyme [Couchioplanes caeruleus]ROP31332.1 acetylornithine aminotransferase [Couchioplanes caeruleus]
MRLRDDGGSREPLTGCRPRTPAGDRGAPGPRLVEGVGAVVTDDAGRDYLDLLGGAAANVLGHAHPAVVAAVSAQAAAPGHAAGRGGAGPAVLLAELLLALTGRGRVLFTDSGAAANETAVEACRRTGRSQVVTAAGSLTGPAAGPPPRTGRSGEGDPSRALPDDVTPVPFGDVEALRAAVGGATAAVVLEPIQGGSGVVVPPPGYLAAAREICTAAGALLVLDEVGTGLGRTGYWFHYQSEGVEPDVVTLAVGSGGGLPLGACLAFGPAADLLTHRTAPAAASGGDPVDYAAGLAVIRTIAGKGLLDHVKRVGGQLRGGIEALAHPLVAGVRGAGLLLGIVLAEPVAVPVTDRLRAAGFLVDAVRPGVIRLAPPLILTAAQADAFVAALEQALGGVSVAPPRPQRLLLRDAA